MEQNLTQKNIALSGDRPTGQLHIGHYFGSLQNRIHMQDNYQLFIIVADTQVMNNNIEKIFNVEQNIIEVMKDYLSVGIDPNKVIFFRQSKILELFELTNYLSNIVTLPQIMRNPTIEAENKAYNSEVSIGFLNYPISQTADVVLFNATHIPVGVDQIPILNLSNDIIKRFNYKFKTNILQTINPILSNNQKIIGVDGNNKMSKSLGNAIYLNSNEKDIKDLVMKMYTDENHLKISDPGKVEGNVVFTFLDLFHKNIDELNDLKINYQKGGIGDVYLKNILIKDINDFLYPIREMRKNISKDFCTEILKKGTETAKEIAKQNMEKLRSIIFQ